MLNLLGIAMWRNPRTSAAPIGTASPIRVPSKCRREGA